MKVHTNSGGIGFPGMLGVLFIGLKLTGYIDWSWWWVLAPFWIGFALVLAVLIVAALIAAGVTSFGQRRRPLRQRFPW